jgi:hypothetical protein
MSSIPIIAGKSGTCLNKKIPAKVMRTIPIPDQIAYAMPTGIVFSVRLRKKSSNIANYGYKTWNEFGELFRCF